MFTKMEKWLADIFSRSNNFLSFYNNLSSKAMFNQFCIFIFSIRIEAKRRP